MESQESGPLFSICFSFLLISDWLHSADRLCPDRTDGGEDIHQLLGFITVYSATPEEKDSTIHSLYISVPGWILFGLSLDATPTPLPINMSRVRELP